jgi:hypothetical protein
VEKVQLLKGGDSNGVLEGWSILNLWVSALQEEACNYSSVIINKVDPSYNSLGAPRFCLVYQHFLHSRCRFPIHVQWVSVAHSSLLPVLAR